MARRRTVGYVQNEWKCPNCETHNKGSEKTCMNCGAPQPDDVQFELGADGAFVTDEKQIQAAQAGADIHCGFCGTRNPATAVVCAQCGADLKEGKAREAGRIMHAPPPPPRHIKCANCGTDNSGANNTCSNCGAALPKIAQTPRIQSAAETPMSGVSPAPKKKTNWLLVGGILGLAVLCCVVAGFAFLVPTSSVQGTVSSVYWQTFVPLQEVRSVSYSNERGNPPSDAYNVSCYDESRDVCEQKTIDKGNGFSEVVEECHVETQQYCSYTRDEWTTIQTYTLEGDNLNPVYDTPNHAFDQRLGEESEELRVTFSTPNGTETYSPGSISEFQQFSVGSTWTLKMNALGGVVDITR